MPCTYSLVAAYQNFPLSRNCKGFLIYIDLRMHFCMSNPSPQSSPYPPGQVLPNNIQHQFDAGSAFGFSWLRDSTPTCFYFNFFLLGIHNCPYSIVFLLTFLLTSSNHSEIIWLLFFVVLMTILTSLFLITFCITFVQSHSRSNYS